MHTTFIYAHFDGERILLDEPFEMEPNTKLLITVLHEADAERTSWLQVSAERLEAAYGDNEPEYTLSSVREMNPHYD